jgi:hypothetical protein
MFKKKKSQIYLKNFSRYYWGFMLARQVLYHLSHSASPFLLFFFFFAVLGLELRAVTLSHYTSRFYEGFFKIRSHKLFARALSLE